MLGNIIILVAVEFDVKRTQYVFLKAYPKSVILYKKKVGCQSCISETISMSKKKSQYVTSMSLLHTSSFHHLSAFLDYRLHLSIPGPVVHPE